MIKNEQKIINNFYGINIDLQINIYNMLLESLDEENDIDFIKALENMLESGLRKIRELYELNIKGLSLKSYYTEKLLNNNREYIDNYLTSSSYYKNSDYKESFFYNCRTYNMNIFNLTNQIFETQKIEPNIVQEFINSFSNSRYNEQKNFIRKFITNNYYCTYIPEKYIPGINIMDNDFDDLILHLFGDKVFEQYCQLEPIRKADFIFKFRKEISTYYNNQNKNKFNKKRNLIKRPAGIR